MINRYYVVCPGCDSTIVLRLSIGLEKKNNRSISYVTTVVLLSIGADMVARIRDLSCISDQQSQGE